MLQPHRKVSCLTTLYTKKSGKWLLLLQRFLPRISFFGLLTKSHYIIHQNREIFYHQSKKNRRAIRLCGCSAAQNAHLWPFWKSVQGVHLGLIFRYYLGRDDAVDFSGHCHNCYRQGKQKYRWQQLADACHCLPAQFISGRKFSWYAEFFQLSILW